MEMIQHLYPLFQGKVIHLRKIAEAVVCKDWYGEPRPFLVFKEPKAFWCVSTCSARRRVRQDAPPRYTELLVSFPTVSFLYTNRQPRDTNHLWKVYTQKRERPKQTRRKTNVSGNERQCARMVLIFQRYIGKYQWMKLYDWWDLLQINTAVLGWERTWGGSQIKTLAFMLIIVKAKY